MELEAFAVESLHLLGQIFAVSLESIADNQLRDEVDEHKGSCTGAESDMDSFTIQLQSASHWSLDEELLAFSGLADVIHLDAIAAIDQSLKSIRLVNAGGQSFRHIVGLESQVDGILVLAEHQCIVKVFDFSCEDSLS